MRAIYRKDLSSYFHSMIGYVVIAFILAVVGIYFMAYNMSYGYPYFSQSLNAGFIIFFLAIPILTMRSFSEEQKSGTDQLLLTSPVNLAQVVAGKYLAMLTVLLIPTVLFCFCPLFIRMYGNWYPGTDYASLFMFFLLGAVFVAAGMFISALTRSQILAAVGTCALMFLMYLWDGLIAYLPSAWSTLTGVLEKLAVMPYFDEVSQYDILDVDGIVYYLSLIFLFCFLTVQTIRRRRWH